MSGFSKKTKAVFAFIAVGAVIYTGIEIVQRQHHVHVLVKEAKDSSIPRVQYINPQTGPTVRNLTLPGNVTAWYQAPIYAQVSGYVKQWYKDFGADVKAGDILATIDTPGLDAEYEAARANLKVAQTKYQLAKVTAQRWKALSGTKAVSQQEVDVQAANAKVQDALVDAAKHDVDRYAALQAFRSIRAPFDGVVTSRLTDVGDFVNDNGDLSRSGKATELFTVADIHRLRVFVDVPQDYASILKSGVKAELTAIQYPGKIFKADYLTSARAFNTTTRTVTTELTVDNASHLLWPGTFVNVHFIAPADPNILILPEQALIFRAQGMQVAVIGTDNRVRMHNVTLGNNLGKSVQILSGVTKTDRVVNNPSAGLMDGQLVKLVDSTPGYNDDFQNTEQITPKHENESLKKNAAQPVEVQQ
ncbi:Multidrug efflux pump subunit AcrA (membrane-fusion protein) (AcrA) (PDB:1T5E) [Commensalibacter communis]|uniref:Multidrug efflux pump subunit AcrA (Membrane-fusion protein) (AcrA) n=1 Tax=Commensalibacter communis TaxID=2972786 RepID=A0A9W4TP27_9PROT|nr:efflux RND transporter periplasmic adaptor subunit [Commensalibacter communis]CAI3922932.1 Multidrug efflux pump subunit AcrA (membrane-fusion protein) (AcrA) (PDB:1T5E) [Commensalibacter communis]CAI3924394.1 Multidrug efflux pump subunit AcrA (membrane-fusion protein) (AcrA) (PDB:1T5E) [Commensalibacter communis]CAI3924470.1 Multidrug efflux pump subunit AcrA (membrane-fusion protein) (AcrA) (PDB:1T5E) [Commensalibacter communis]CAI3924699.1 Multidrug efflux pump subunit AcrA (membrane-fus